MNFRPNDINHKRKDRLGRMKGRVGGSAGGDRRGGECRKERKGGEEDGSRGREEGGPRREGNGGKTNYFESHFVNVTSAPIGGLKWNVPPF